MEKCQIVKGQRAFDQLTDDQKKAMTEHTTIKPHVRFRKIVKTVSLYNFLWNLYL